ncbi:hypothetical protein HZC33_02480 [Candidatus Wolfebacteria bacterium]|nr:hypothetical protein [Candidatus Wolfebacteria bacterium]
MNKETKILIAISVLILAGIISLAIFANKNEKPNLGPGQFDSFAKCLAQKQITMYGAYWCAHCQNEKKAFGNSFQYVPYVECTKETKLCLEKGVEGYPTWIFPDGRKLVGEQGIEKLSKESGCALP